MKKNYSFGSSAFKRGLLAAVIGCSLLAPRLSFGQTYYSRFADPTGKYSVSSPFGTGCDATPIQNAVGLADNDENSYAYFSANISSPYTCTSPNYIFTTELNLPPDTLALSPGNQAGFKVRIPTSISSDSLGKYVTIRTYLNGVLQESKSGNQLLGLDPSQSHINWFVYFVTAKPYNSIELVVNAAIIKLNSDFEFDVYYALGATSIVLPAQIDNFKATTTGKSVALTWQSLTETNVSSFTVQRSSDGGASYANIATLPAKGNSTATVSYKYTDNVSADGSYLYRLVTNSKDGSAKTTNAVTAVVSGMGKMLLYPSVVKAGQSFIIKTSLEGTVTTQLFDAQGRMVKQQRNAVTGQITVNTGTLSAGMYTVKLTAANGKTLLSKVMVN